MKKRVLFAFVAAVMCAALCLTGCGKKNTGGGGDPYVPGSGFLSAQTYGTPDEAINAFIENELSDEYRVDVKLVNETKTGDLTDTEKAELKITDEQRAGITSAEKYNVTYAESLILYDSENHEPVLQTPMNSDITVYLLGYGANEYRYFTPAPKVGETVTNSYFQSLLDPDLYRNLTLIGSMIEDYKSSEDYEPITITWTETSKITAEAYSDLVKSEEKNKTTGEVEQYSKYTYYKKTGDGVGEMIGVSGELGETGWEYEKSEATGWELTVTYEDCVFEVIVGEFFETYIDQSPICPILMKKTATGLEIKKSLLYNNILGEKDILTNYSITVKNGRITSISLKEDATLDEGSPIAYTTVTVTFTDFGTTTITETDFPTGFHDFADDILTAE